MASQWLVQFPRPKLMLMAPKIDPPSAESDPLDLQPQPLLLARFIGKLDFAAGADHSLPWQPRGTESCAGTSPPRGDTADNRPLPQPDRRLRPGLWGSKESRAGKPRREFRSVAGHLSQSLALSGAKSPEVFAVLPSLTDYYARIRIAIRSAHERKISTSCAEIVPTL